MNKDLIEFYEEQKNKLQKEIEALWEVGKKSPSRIKRIVEIEYIINGLNSDKENMRIKQELRDYKIGYYNLKQAINEIKEKLLCYGETFDSDIHKRFQKECLEIIEKLGDNNE